MFQTESTYGIGRLGAAALRSAPRGRSDLVSQLLFGEAVEVVDRRAGWEKVRLAWDNTTGWLRAGQLIPVSAEDFLLARRDAAHTLDLLQPVFAPDHAVPVPLGSSLPGYDGLRFRMGAVPYTYGGQIVRPTAAGFRPSVAFLLNVLQRYAYAPQLAGGRTPLGIDAGGLVQNVFRLLGVRTYRQPEAQIRQGKLVEFIQDALPGDLAFFEQKAGRANHVGILLPDGNICHVHGHVRTDRIDHAGIFDATQQRYTHQLRLIRRLVDLEPLPPEPEVEVKVAARQVRLF